MKLSVVVSTLNSRERLLSCLDVLAERTPASTELIVVNGPSSDGTTGAVRDRDDVDVLVEISERNRGVSCNAGFEAASGEAIAFLGDQYTVEPTWYDALETAITSGADVVTGPVAGSERAGERRTPQRIARRRVTHFDGDNVAFERTVLEALDGFDEYIDLGGARDCAHRVAGLGFEVTWNAEMAVRCDPEADTCQPTHEWGERYRSLAYRLSKTYGPRPAVLGHVLASAVRNGVSSARAILSGESTPTGWFGNGTDVVKNVGVGFRDGVRARFADRSKRRNPNGVSTRHDRAVQMYDWR